MHYIYREREREKVNVLSVMIIVVGNANGEPSLNAEQDCLYFTNTIEKSMHPPFFVFAMDE